MKAFYLFTFIILLINISLEEEEELPPGQLEIDTQNCAQTEYEKCFDTEIRTPGHSCCKISEVTADSPILTCELKTTEEEQNKLVGSSLIINKELGGIAIYNEKYGGVTGNVTEREMQMRRVITITCPKHN